MVSDQHIPGQMQFSLVIAIIKDKLEFKILYYNLFPMRNLGKYSSHRVFPDSRVDFSGKQDLAAL